jgi:hypothetical protein
VYNVDESARLKLVHVSDNFKGSGFVNRGKQWVYAKPIFESKKMMMPKYEVVTTYDEHGERDYTNVINTYPGNVRWLVGVQVITIDLDVDLKVE